MEEFEAAAKERVGLCRDFVKQAQEMGLEAAAAQALALRAAERAEAGQWQEALKLAAQAVAECRRAKPRRDFPYVEPESLEDIKAASPGGFSLSLPAPPEGAVLDRVHGGWLGKVIGGALGEPVEGWPRQRIEQDYGEIADYLTKPPSTLNDDTAYEVLAIHALEEYGPGLTSEQLGWEWVEHLPKAYTAEKVALDNLRRGIAPPESAVLDNPYSEWIGGQMKGEVWGLLAPGRPDVAAEYAYLDAVIAHRRNGVYGEMYNAALVSAAFVESDPRRLAEMGLEFVPAKSRFAEVVRRTIDWCSSAAGWRESWRRVEETYAEQYHPVHTLPNVGAVLVGLLHGGGDFGRVVCITTMCGLDTDCTAGQAGASAGTICGAAAIPARWKEPVNDMMETYVAGFETLSVTDLAGRTLAQGRRLLASIGGNE
jgi:ADP-ribosylglycohydrolase